MRVKNYRGPVLVKISTLQKHSSFFLVKVGEKYPLSFGQVDEISNFLNMPERKVTLLKYASLEGSVLCNKGLPQEIYFTFTGAFFFFFKYLFIYLFGCAGSSLRHVGFLVAACVRDLFPRPGIKPGPPSLGSAESYPLDHQGSPYFYWNFI